MKNKKILGLIFALILSMVVLAGCASDGEDLSAAEILDRSSEAMGDVESLSMDLNLDFNMDMTGMGMEESIKMNMVAVADCFVDPLKMKLDVTMTGQASAEDMDMKMEGYIIQDGAELITYMRDTETNVWEKTVEPYDMEALKQYDVKIVNNMLDTYLKECELVGSEKVNGKDCYKLNVVFDLSSLPELYNSLGIPLDEVGLDAESLEAFGDLMMVIYVEKDTFYHVKYELDLTENLNSIMAFALGMDAEMLEQLGFTIECTANMDIVLVYDEIQDFEIPQEALDA